MGYLQNIHEVVQIPAGITIRVWNGQKSFEGTNAKRISKQVAKEVFQDLESAFDNSVTRTKAIIEKTDEQTVAKKSGLMRASFRDAQEVNKHISLSAGLLELEFTFNYSKFIDAPEYIKYHVLQDIANRFLFYQLPTTPNTRPLDLAFWDSVEILMNSFTQQEFRLLGYNF